MATTQRQYIKQKELSDSFKYDQTQIDEIIKKVTPVLKKGLTKDAVWLAAFYIRKNAEEMNRPQFNGWLEDFLAKMF